MSGDSESPVALITGAGTGLGRALATSLAQDGFAVALHYRTNREGAECVVKELCASGMDAASFCADLAVETEALQLAADVAARFGRLDLLVNNAGAYQESHGLELTASEWFEGLNSTVTQTFFITRAMLPLLRREKVGRVINIGDSSADRPGARDLAWSYHIGKTGVWMLTRSFAAAEAVNGVAVNMVSPGFLENSVGNVSPSDMPSGHFGAFTDVYAAVRFLALEAPVYITGSNLMVGGGWNLR
jgi:NAD(P)-dependent dehydrogenase (short-subunit alcohol dehydrogenase family)